jgi:hypothetical protein
LVIFFFFSWLSGSLRELIAEVAQARKKARGARGPLQDQIIETFSKLSA